MPASETAMPWHERLIDECQTAFRKKNKHIFLNLLNYITTCGKDRGHLTNKSEILQYLSLCVARYLLTFHQQPKVYIYSGVCYLITRVDACG